MRRRVWRHCGAGASPTKPEVGESGKTQPLDMSKVNSEDSRDWTTKVRAVVQDMKVSFIQHGPSALFEAC